ncbi:hypothetical protein SAVIM40S_03217 [Streptomyces avidinii]
MSRLMAKTLREDPADAETLSHRLLVRAGYVRRSSAGVWTWLPLGKRVLDNVSRIVREEMDAIGAQEVLLPALLPKEPYEVSGRWSEYGDLLFRLKDRKGADYLLGPTHEEIFTLVASLCEACSSASALITRARRSRSASACRAIDRFMVSGRDTSLISTRSI